MNDRPKEFQNLRLYRSNKIPCPYLADRFEEQAYLLVEQENLLKCSDQLNRLGFRRSMNSVYIPICQNCNACQSVRIKVADFQPSRNQKKIMRRYPLEFSQQPLIADSQNHLLFQHYMSARHPESDMTSIDLPSFAQLIETSPEGAFALSAYQQDTLVGMMMVDQFSDGLSAVYSFYEPDLSQWSIGTQLVLSLIDSAKKMSLPYVYLGYYVAGSPKMSYKKRFAALQVLDWTAIDWIDFNYSSESDLPNE